MIVRASKIGDFKLKKLIWHFVVDIDATKTSLIVRINRNTVNRYYQLFRTVIYQNQQEEFQKAINGEAECDEAYFGGKRKRGVPGKRGRGRVSTEAIVHTDKWKGYDGLVDVGFDRHKRINHSQAFSYGNGNHINGIENFWSFTKRRLAKFNGCKVNFMLHLKECEWRYGKKKEQLCKELIVLLKKYRFVRIS